MVSELLNHSLQIWYLGLGKGFCNLFEADCEISHIMSLVRSVFHKTSDNFHYSHTFWLSDSPSLLNWNGNLSSHFQCRTIGIPYCSKHCSYYLQNQQNLLKELEVLATHLLMTHSLETVQMQIFWQPNKKEHRK